MEKLPPLLIVEDSDEDFEVMCWALQKIGFTHPILRAERAETALLHLFPKQPVATIPKPLPCLVLMDLNMPGMNGLEFLEEVSQRQPKLAIPIVVMSTSTNPLDISACYGFGAAGYIIKPFKLEEYMETIRALTLYWFNTVKLPEKNYDEQ